MDQDEIEMIEELAAALVDSISDAIVSSATESAEEAVGVLGADDGMEFDLPGVLKDPSEGGPYVMEELLTRPELKSALTNVATELLRKLKTGG